MAFVVPPEIDEYPSRELLPPCSRPWTSPVFRKSSTSTQSWRTLILSQSSFRPALNHSKFLARKAGAIEKFPSGYSQMPWNRTLK